MTLPHNSKCALCDKIIDHSKPYITEEITEWIGDKGKSIERDYHRLCFLRSRR